MTGAVLVFPVAGDKLSVGLLAAVWAAAPRPLPAGAGPTLRCPGTGVQIATGFLRQECWNALSFPPPGNLSDPGNRTRTGISYLAGGFFTNGHLGSLHWKIQDVCFFFNEVGTVLLSNFLPFQCVYRVLATALMGALYIL